VTNRKEGISMIVIIFCTVLSVDNIDRVGGKSSWLRSGAGGPVVGLEGGRDVSAVDGAL
jgi:hypothetical protein